MRADDAARLVGRARLVRRCREGTALLATLARFCTVVHPLVRRQLDAWERLALQIPDPQLRSHALATLRSERLSAAGAAMFAAALPRPPRELVETLVAFQVMWDYLDTLSEQPVPDPVRNGAQLHRALADALDDGPAAADWYRHHPSTDDGGYLEELVAACRARCGRLPAYEHVRAAALRETGRVTVQGANHAPAHVREPLLRRWAAAQEDVESDLAWFELAAAASSSMAIIALLTAAACPRTEPAAAERIRAAYFPWVDLLTTLLDSHVDAEADAAAGEWSVVAHYPSEEAAGERLASVCRQAFAAARDLPRPEQHVVLTAGMMALFLSHPSAWTARAAATTRATIAAADTQLLLVLLPLLRGWRALHARQAPRVGADAPAPLLRGERAAVAQLWGAGSATGPATP